MDTGGDTPTMVRHVPGRGLPRQVRRALGEGATVVLLSKRDSDLRRTLAEVGESPATSVRLGDGRTATFLQVDGRPDAYAWWPRQDDQVEWVWACRACGTVDDRWSWQDVDETTPMVRHAVVLDQTEEVEVPWPCPRGTCHGAARWQPVEDASVARSVARGA